MSPLAFLSQTLARGKIPPVALPQPWPQEPTARGHWINPSRLGVMPQLMDPIFEAWYPAPPTDR